MLKNKQCLECRVAIWHDSTYCKKCALKGKRNPSWKGGEIIDKDGYILIKILTHPFANNAGYIREHRLVIEKSLGRYLKSDEIVHHINHKKSDNRIKNLMLLQKKNHFKHGHSEIMKKLKPTQFQKRHIPPWTGKKGWTNKGSFKKDHS